MTCTTVPAGTDASGTSNIACWKFGSNFWPCGSNFFTPCFSSALSSERSVSSTPSISEVRPGSAAARVSCFGRRKSSARDRPKRRSAAQEATDDAGSIVHGRDHAGIIQPGRPDYAQNTDDVAGGIPIGRDDGGGAGQREQLVLAADENPYAFGGFCAPQQVDHAALGLEIVE